jgi:hypothetical protein
MSLCLPPNKAPASNIVIPIPVPPTRRVLTLPHLSIYMTAGIVAITDTTPLRPVASNCEAVPFNPAPLKMRGAIIEMINMCTQASQVRNEAMLTIIEY